MPTDRIDKILKPVERYMHGESTAGIVLLVKCSDSDDLGKFCLE